MLSKRNQSLESLIVVATMSAGLISKTIFVLFFYYSLINDVCKGTNLLSQRQWKRYEQTTNVGFYFSPYMYSLHASFYCL